MLMADITKKVYRLMIYLLSEMVPALIVVLIVSVYHHRMAYMALLLLSPQVLTMQNSWNGKTATLTPKTAAASL